MKTPARSGSWFVWLGALLLGSSAVEFVQLLVVDPTDWDDMVHLGSSGALAVALAWAARATDPLSAAARAGSAAFAVFALGLVAIWVAFSIHAGSVFFFGFDLGHPFGRGAASSDRFVTSLGRAGGFQGDPILGFGLSVAYGVSTVAWVVSAPVLGAFARQARAGGGTIVRRALFAILATTSIWLELGRSVDHGELALIATESASLVWLAWALLRTSGRPLPG